MHVALQEDGEEEDAGRGHRLFVGETGCASWGVPGTSVLQRLKQEDHAKFETSIGFIINFRPT